MPLVKLLQKFIPDSSALCSGSAWLRFVVLASTFRA